MVKKTTVLDERWIMRMRKETDLRVGQDKPAYQIILQITLDRSSKRFLRQTAPRFAGNIINIKPAAKLFFRDQGFQHAVPGMLGKDARQIVKFLHLLVLHVASGKIGHRSPTHLFINIADEQSIVMTILRIRGKRSSRALP